MFYNSQWFKYPVTKHILPFCIVWLMITSILVFGFLNFYDDTLWDKRVLILLMLIIYAVYMLLQFFFNYSRNKRITGRK